MHPASKTLWGHLTSQTKKHKSMKLKALILAMLCALGIYFVRRKIVIFLEDLPSPDASSMLPPHHPEPPKMLPPHHPEPTEMPPPHRPEPPERPPPSALKLLPEEKYLSNFSHNGISMFQGNRCTCKSEKGLYIDQLWEVFKPEEIESINLRRKKEFEHFKKRYKSHPQDVLIAQPNSPLSYPVYGVEVMPLHTILVPGLGVHVPTGEHFQVTLLASLGTFNTLADVSEKELQGRGEKQMTISSPHIELVNFILQHVTYTSTVYHVHTVDMVRFAVGPHATQFPVVIRQPIMPRLYDPGAERNINSLVTITTKTFLRYQKLHILIKSIRQYYPNITIIIADDNEQPEKIQDPNVEQYFMPFGKGWFAGRNLAVSQVTTKYFLWVDDDWIFTEDTKIEKLVEVLENTNLDVVAGSLAGDAFSFKLLYEEGDEDGDCVHGRGGSYQPIEGFPNCALTGGVANLFLGHTARVQSVGFDPKLARVAHTEFFIDGLGTLLFGSCKDVNVGHQRNDDPVDSSRVEKMKKYKAFRTNTRDHITFKLRLQYFKNRLKCYTKR